MAGNDKAACACALPIAFVAWTGLILEYAATLGQQASVLGTLWSLCGFFTIITNAAVAIAFTAIALARRCLAAARTMTGLTLSILLVGIVYRLMLQDQDRVTGDEILANMLLHKATPILVALYWLIAVHKGEIARHDPLIWSIYPLAYLGYALARAAAGNGYPYPFLDPTGQGWTGVGINVLAIAIGFLSAGYAILWADRRLAAHQPWMRSSFSTVLPLYSASPNAAKPSFAATRSDATLSGSMMQTVRGGANRASIQPSAARAASVA